MKYTKYIILSSLLMFFSCFSTPIETKSDLEMYREMVSYNASSEFARFSDVFVDLSSNHPSSPYLENAFLIAIGNSIDISEFKMADFYLSKMKSQFVDEGNRDFYEFYALKIAFLRLDDKNRNQKEFEELKMKIEEFIIKYDSSDYRYLAMDIKSSIDASLYVLNEKIAVLYKQRGQDYSSNAYKMKNEKLKIKRSDIKKVKSFFIVELFE